LGYERTCFVETIASRLVSGGVSRPREARSSASGDEEEGAEAAEPANEVRPFFFFFFINLKPLKKWSTTNYAPFAIDR